MVRIEIVANKSVEDDITQTLERYVQGILYTKIPLAYGRGGDDRKLGNSTWPETNFVLTSYVKDSELATVKSVIRGVKRKFPDEGIKLFAVKSLDI